jgi:2-methylaconitate cis-trans-isomerase PrpF
MANVPQIRIPATYMRGGTSKGVFFRLQDLPAKAQVPGVARDALLMRVIGSPDPYGKQIDGMGGATSSTSKTVILAKSSRPDHDVDYTFGQVSIDKAVVDRSACPAMAWRPSASGRRTSARPSWLMCPLPKAPCRKPVISNSMA